MQVVSNSVLSIVADPLFKELAKLNLAIQSATDRRDAMEQEIMKARRVPESQRKEYHYVKELLRGLRNCREGVLRDLNERYPHSKPAHIAKDDDHGL